MHLIFKVATILFALVWLVGIGLEAMQVWQPFGPMQVGGEIILDPLGEPWRSWFKRQTNMVAAPLITLGVLYLFTYLAKPTNKKGRGA